MPGVFGLRETRIEKIKNISTSSFRYWSESAKYGYFGGGQIAPINSSVTSIITRLDFSNETVSDPGKNLPTGRSSATGVSNNSYGYFGGGEPGLISTITRLDFSNETVRNPGNNFIPGRSYVAGVSNNFYGYFGGGYDGSNMCTITRLDFSNETVFNPGNNLPVRRWGAAGLTNSN